MRVRVIDVEDKTGRCLPNFRANTKLKRKNSSPSDWTCNKFVLIY